MSGLARDLRHAARSLARTPGFSLAAILVDPASVLWSE
jgi:hypothetical protein